MPLFRAIGLVIVIIALRLLVPVVFSHIENTAIAFLDGAETSAQTASAIASSLPIRNQPPMFPQALSTRTSQ